MKDCWRKNLIPRFFQNHYREFILSKSQSVRVIGGGFSGLIQAFYLLEQGVSVTVFEKENRLGGLLGSHVEDGFLNEQAANAFIANEEFERICQLIGVNLVSLEKAAKKRFIYRSGEMSRFPLSKRSLLPIVKFVFKAMILKSSFGVQGRESLQEWSDRTFNKETTKFLLEPAMQGIFAASSDKLQASMVLNSLFTRYKRGSLKGSVAPCRGMQEFLDKMKIYLEEKGCQFQLENSEGIDESSEIKVLAVGLGHLKGLHTEGKIKLPESIEKTKVTSLTSVKFLYQDQVDFKEGFGCLFPRSEGFNSLGVLFNKNIFPGRVEHGASETWILNDQQMKFSEMSQFALKRYVQSDRNKLSGVIREPYKIIVNQWRNRLPLYDESLCQFNEDLNEFKTSDYFVGNYLGQLGLSKIIFRAQENAMQIREELSV